VSNRERKRAVPELAWAILAGVALGLALTFAPSWVSAAEHAAPSWVLPRMCGGNHRDTAKTDTKTLVQVVDTFKLNHPGAGAECPTTADLKAERALEPDQNTNDPWGRPYRIVCSGDLYGVMSSGPDGTAGTEDDVWAGEKPSEGAK